MTLEEAINIVDFERQNMGREPDFMEACEVVLEAARALQDSYPEIVNLKGDRKFMCFPIKEDKTLPKGAMELREKSGKVLGRIVDADGECT